MDKNIDKVLTIIVPAYNAEKYLNKALQSCITVPTTQELEVIVVNDGSTDRTEEIVKGYLENDIFSLINKKNGGHGSAINAAVSVARGKYIKVVDADDWIVTDNLPRLLSILKETDADVVVSPFDTIDMCNGNVKRFSYNYTFDKPCSLAQILSEYSQVLGCITFHGIIYRTETYREADFMLSEKIFYEDHEFATIPFAKVKTILPIDLVFYQYLVGNAEQSVAFHNQVKRISHIQMVIESILQYWNKANIQDEAIKRYFALKVSSVIVSYYSVALVKNPDKKTGRLWAASLRSYLLHEAPHLVKMTDKKYFLRILCNRLHISSDIYIVIKKTTFYGILSRFIKMP